MNIYQCPVCGKEFKEYPSRVSRKGCCSRKCTYDPKIIFWNKVRKTDSCWIWLGSLTRSGYGQFTNLGKNWTAPRFAWILTHGPITEGLCVLHNCPGGDNPACVNPDHLWLGTQLDNIADCIAKNRHARGVSNGHARLTEENVKKIRTDYGNGGILQRELATQYQVSRTLISAIVIRRAWKHI